MVTRIVVATVCPLPFWARLRIIRAALTLRVLHGWPHPRDVFLIMVFGRTHALEQS